MSEENVDPQTGEEYPTPDAVEEEASAVPTAGVGDEPSVPAEDEAAGNDEEGLPEPENQ